MSEGTDGNYGEIGEVFWDAGVGSSVACSNVKGPELENKIEALVIIGDLLGAFNAGLLGTGDSDWKGDSLGELIFVGMLCLLVICHHNVGWSSSRRPALVMSGADPWKELDDYQVRKIWRGRDKSSILSPY